MRVREMIRAMADAKVEIKARKKVLAVKEDPALKEAIQEGLRAKEIIAEQRRRLEESKGVIRSVAEEVAGDHSVIHMVAGDAAAKVTFKDEFRVRPEKVEELRRWLRAHGYDPADFIEEKVEYRPKKALVEILHKAGETRFLKVKTHKPTVDFYAVG